MAAWREWQSAWTRDLDNKVQQITRHFPRLLALERRDWELLDVIRLRRENESGRFIIIFRDLATPLNTFVIRLCILRYTSVVDWFNKLPTKRKPLSRFTLAVH
jgi:hypothetical protein